MSSVYNVRKVTVGNDFRCWQGHSMADHGLRVPGGPGWKVYVWEPPTGRSPLGQVAPSSLGHALPRITFKGIKEGDASL